MRFSTIAAVQLGLVALCFASPAPQITPPPLLFTDDSSLGRRSPDDIGLLYTIGPELEGRSLGEIDPPLLFTDAPSLEGRSPASPLLAERSLPPAAVCSKIKGLVSLLKLKNATPFCSSFLDIQTVTSTDSTSTTQLADITSSTTTTITETIVASTQTISFLTTITTGTQTLTVATQTERVTTYTTRPFTTTTTTTTTTYVPPPAKRDLVERAAPIPGWLAGFASAAVSTGCLCLDIPTPTTTITATSTITNTLTFTRIETATSISSITTTTSETKTSNVVYTTPYTHVTVVTTTITSSTAILTVTSTTTLVLPTPSLCRAPITLYNGLRPRDFAPLITHNYGDIPIAECCMKCFVLPGCIAYVRSGGNCLGLTVAANRYPNPPSPRCPWGVGDTIFGNPPGAVGQGPCHNIWEWN